MGNVIVRAGPDKGKHLSRVAHPSLCVASSGNVNFDERQFKA